MYWLYGSARVCKRVLRFAAPPKPSLPASPPTHPASTDLPAQFKGQTACSLVQQGFRTVLTGSKLHAERLTARMSIAVASSSSRREQVAKTGAERVSWRWRLNGAISSAKPAEITRNCFYIRRSSQVKAGHASALRTWSCCNAPWTASCSQPGY